MLQTRLPETVTRTVDTGGGTVFGPFPSGTKIKCTKEAEAPPEAKSMGGRGQGSGGKADAVDWHIIGNCDAPVIAVG